MISEIKAALKAAATFDWLVRFGRYLYQKSETSKELKEAEETNDPSKIEDRASRSRD